MGFSFLTQELAIDLGTANTVIFQNDQIVLDEPSIVAIDNSTGKALALGQKAKLMQERENPGIKTIRPLKDGVIADFNAAEMMIRGFIKQVNSKRRSLFQPNLKIVVGIPSGSTEVEIRAVRDSTEHAGGRDVYLIYEPMAYPIHHGCRQQEAQPYSHDFAHYHSGHSTFSCEGQYGGRLAVPPLPCPHRRYDCGNSGKYLFHTGALLQYLQK